MKAQRYDLVALFCALGAALFYVSFASRFFMGDDWLWLLEAHRALDDPLTLLQRNIYGYLRPLSLALLSIWSVIAGGSAPIYSAVSLVLHGTNVWLLYRVVIAYGGERSLAITAAFMSAFYYLNAPAITWISVTPDLMVTALVLLFLRRYLAYAKQPTTRSLMPLVILGVAAVLIKESGFVCLGLFVAGGLIVRSHQRTRLVLPHAAIMVGVFAAYLAYYFATRTVVDKELAAGWSTVTHLWYFLAYALFPLSARIADMIPDSLAPLLTALRIISIIAVPVLFFAVWRFAGAVGRAFLAWSILFVATISLFQWDVSLVSLYPERTAARYMYSVNFGYSVLLAWVLTTFWKRWLAKRRLAGAAVVILAILFLAGNVTVVTKVTAKYRTEQDKNRRMFDTVVGQVEAAAVDSVCVRVPETAQMPGLLTKPRFLQGMIAVGTDRVIPVHIERVDTTSLQKGTAGPASCAILRWDEVHDRLEPAGSAGY
ncbi:hypothetical protein GF377_05965 [candidate division GN15 bacterium]|nr:hypothetical protein [candidate division GN15 bacterium]